jgi:hypothetical protein
MSLILAGSFLLDSTFKRLSHRMDWAYVDTVDRSIVLNKKCGRFLNFLNAPPLLGLAHHQQQTREFLPLVNFTQSLIR